MKIQYFKFTISRATILKIVEQKTPGNPYELSATWIESIEEYTKNGRILR